MRSRTQSQSINHNHQVTCLCESKRSFPTHASSQFILCNIDCQCRFHDRVPHWIVQPLKCPVKSKQYIWSKIVCCFIPQNTGSTPCKRKGKLVSKVPRVYLEYKKVTVTNTWVRYRQIYSLLFNTVTISTERIIIQLKSHSHCGEMMSRKCSYCLTSTLMSSSVWKDYTEGASPFCGKGRSSMVLNQD